MTGCPFNPLPPGKKKCCSCEGGFSINYFCKNRRSKDGRDTYCRRCKGLKNKSYALYKKYGNSPGSKKLIGLIRIHVAAEKIRKKIRKAEEEKQVAVIPILSEKRFFALKLMNRKY